MVSIEYSQKEIEDLINTLRYKYSSHMYYYLDHMISHILLKQDNFEEIIIYKKNINYHNKGYFGEGNYFVIFNSNHYHYSEFCIYTRHLKRFLLELPFNEVCIFLNLPFIQTIAKWRLEIGK